MILNNSQHMLNFHLSFHNHYYGSSKCREKIVNFRSYKFTALTFTNIANTLNTHRIITILDSNPSKVTRAALGGSRSPAECTTVWHNNGVNRLRWNQKKALFSFIIGCYRIVEMRFMLWEMSGRPQWSMCRFLFSQITFVFRVYFYLARFGRENLHSL